MGEALAHIDQTADVDLYFICLVHGSLNHIFIACQGPWSSFNTAMTRLVFRFIKQAKQHVIRRAIQTHTTA